MKYNCEPLERRTLLAAGDLDPSFGSGGFVTGATPPVVKAITAPNGIFAITTTTGSIKDILIVKFLPNGAPDASFGTGGQIVFGQVQNDDTPIDIAPAAGGQIVVLARRFDSQAPLDQTYVFRVNSDGTIDGTLNATGEIIVQLSLSETYSSITTDPSGTIYVGGGQPGFFLLKKYTPAGTADSGFGTGGTVMFTASTGAQFTELNASATTITAIGSDFNNSFIYRRNAADGLPDAGFASGAFVTIGNVAPISDARIDSQGRIVIMGFDLSGAIVTRYDSAGNLDLSFGVMGIVSLGATQFTNMDIGPGDNISVAGTAGDVLMVRRLLGANGAFDPIYGISGDAMATIPGGSTTQGVSSILAFADESAIVTGGDFEIQDSFFAAKLLGAATQFAVLDTRTGILSVTGTAAADQVLIDIQAATTLVAQLGPDQLFFPAPGVTQINIDVGGGADDVTLTSVVTQTAQVLLGGGNNRYFGGGGDATVLGGGGNDTINGGLGRDFIQGFGGSDSIFGAAGDDTIDTGSGGDNADGADGDDAITGGDGADLIDGAPGNDTIFGRLGPDTLMGADGDDLIVGEGGDDLLIGDIGDDTLAGDDGNDTIDASAGNDSIEAGNGNDVAMGGAGADVASGSFGNDTLIGGTGNDTLGGDEDMDFLDGTDGNDLIDAGPNGAIATGGLGDDCLIGGGGADNFDGAAGNDTLLGMGGKDNILGGDDNDLIDTGSGGDFADGNDGDDSITGGDGPDMIDGAPGNDTIFGRAGDDTLMGAEGRDLIMGEDGNDAIIGGGGDDNLMGGTGSDELSGTMGNDTLDGGGGSDRLFGGDDNDMLMGAAGIDTLDGQNGLDHLSGGDDNDLLLCDDGKLETIEGNAGIDIARGDPGEGYATVELVYRILD